MELKDVEALADLARLELSAEEKKGLLSDIESILNYVRQVEEVGVGEGGSAKEIYNIWREDEEVNREFSRELIVSQFPKEENGFLKVKKIL